MHGNNIERRVLQMVRNCLKYDAIAGNQRRWFPMCGIVGLFLKDKSLESDLGEMLAGMLITMTDRGPDSAGIAVYGNSDENMAKITVQATDAGMLGDIDLELSKIIGVNASTRIFGTHAVVEVPGNLINDAKAALKEICGDLRVMSTGESIEIYKEVGLPADVSKMFEIPGRAGTHGIGHTRMATESAVTTLGAHPFSTGMDQCLVHNGSLSNHNSLRRKLRREGIEVQTDNDTEVAAAYLTWQMQNGMSLGAALEAGVADLDGFYTFVVGTRHGFGVLRDPIACKPAVLAETELYVAFGSEYRALVELPGIAGAKVWEPDPATVYFWEH